MPESELRPSPLIHCCISYQAPVHIQAAALTRDVQTLALLPANNTQCIQQATHQLWSFHLTCLNRS